MIKSIKNDKRFLLKNLSKLNRKVRELNHDNFKLKDLDKDF